MATNDLPVPPGFTITTEIYSYYRHDDASFPDGLSGDVAVGIAISGE